MLDGLKLHFQGFGPLTGEDFFTLVEIVLDHLRDVEVMCSEQSAGSICMEGAVRTEASASDAEAVI